MIPEKEVILKMYKEHKEFCNDQHDETTHPHYDDVECFLRWVGEVIELERSGHMSLEMFKEMWYNSISPSLWCERYAHPLHRICPVHLNYENLPEPFKKLAQEINHKGKTGDTVHAKPETCYTCDRFIGNGGVCDPV